MTKKRHGKWTELKVIITPKEKPDYRSRMSAIAKRVPVVVNYREEVFIYAEQPDNHLFLFKNILN